MDTIPGGLFGLITVAVYLSVLIYLIVLLTRFVEAVERIARVVESVPPRVAGALEKIAEHVERK